MNLITKLAYNPITKAIQAILPGGVSLKIAQTESGTYTPNASNQTNCTAVPQSCMYSRVGNIVTMSGWVLVTASSSSYNFQLSLPIPSDFTSTRDASGIGSRKQGAAYTDISFVEASVANDRIYVEGYGTDTDAEYLVFTCQYQIK